MQIDLTALPDDPAVLQSMIRGAVAVSVQHDAQVTKLTAEIEKLQNLLHKLLRHRFGCRSEQLSPDQLNLAIEDLEQQMAEQQAAKGRRGTVRGAAAPTTRRPPAAQSRRVAVAPAT